MTPEPSLPRVLDLLELWIDPTARDGPANMAVDQWLAESCTVPVLRSYRWQPGWGSFGYFGIQRELPPWPVRWVRRWTGGGIVDHRADWTYTLFVPRGHRLAEARGADSYHTVHAALASALCDAGTNVCLAGDIATTAGGECFLRPVEHDVLNSRGQKIAGAGQRRTSRGLLHQGSVAAVPCPATLARKLALNVVERPPALDAARVMELAKLRYEGEAWLARR